MTGNTTAQDLLDRWQRGNVLASDCPPRPILQHPTSRWGVLVMVALATGTHRFADPRRAVAGISDRMLARVLQELAADGFVLRRAFDVVPPHVEYSLTPLGREAAGHVVALAGFIETALARIRAARPRAA